jgi:hypothetical protein
MRFWMLVVESDPWQKTMSIHGHVTLTGTTFESCVEGFS